MSDEDEYSNKDPYHNQQIDKKESWIMTGIMSVVIGFLIIAFVIYYLAHEKKDLRPMPVTRSEPAKPVSTDPNMSKPYNMDKPPHAQ
jgi:large-conductance mechanosensitive channel